MIIAGNILDILTVIAGIIAAVQWYRSAKIETPNNFSIHIVKPNHSPMGGNPLDGIYIGHAYSNDLVKLADALKRQSKLSANAAQFASVSAIAQAISIIIKMNFQV